MITMIPIGTHVKLPTEVESAYINAVCIRQAGKSFYMLYEVVMWRDGHRTELWMREGEFEIENGQAKQQRLGFRIHNE